MATARLSGMPRNTLAILFAAAGATALAACASPSGHWLQRQELAAPPGAAPSWEVGYRGGLWIGDGVPINDAPAPGGVFARYRLNDDWRAGLGFELASGDFETPHKKLGIVQDPSVAAVDTTADYTSVQAWIERVHPFTLKDELFWLAGLGLAFVTVDDVQGPVQGGGTFDIETDAGTELLGSVGGGYRRRFGAWAAELLVRYDYHVADWELTDQASGATGTIDDYSTLAFLLGFSVSF